VRLSFFEPGTGSVASEKATRFGVQVVLGELSMEDMGGMGIFEAAATVLLTTAISGIIIAAFLKLRFFHNESGHPS
jgi:hypothetical protein